MESFYTNSNSIGYGDPIHAQGSDGKWYMGTFKSYCDDYKSENPTRVLSFDAFIPKGIYKQDHKTVNRVIAHLYHIGEGVLCKLPDSLDQYVLCEVTGYTQNIKPVLQVTRQNRTYDCDETNVQHYGGKATDGLHRGGYKPNEDIWYFDNIDLLWKKGTLFDMKLGEKELHPVIQVVSNKTNWFPVYDDNIKMVTILHADELSCDSGAVKLVNLMDMSNPTLLRLTACLMARFDTGIQYTRLDNSIVSVNPFQYLYFNEDAYMHCYCEKSLEYHTGYVPDEPVPSCVMNFHPGQPEAYVNPKVYPNTPHVWELALRAFHKVTTHPFPNQSIIASGASGSGKSVNTTALMKCIFRCCSVSKNTDEKKATDLLTIYEKATIILNAFGNAKTPHNDDSSRFGKYIKVYIQNKSLVALNIKDYLLERIRCIRFMTDAEDRLYHIFYYAHAKKENKIPINKYNWTGHRFDDIKILEQDAKQYDEVIGAIEMIIGDKKISDEFIKQMIFVLKFIAYNQQIEITNDVAFPKYQNKNGAFGKINTMFGFTNNVVYEKNILLQRQDNKYYEEALGFRDGLSMTMYYELWKSLLDKINAALNPTKVVLDNMNYIGILDIFGFERFTRNSLEQLCINYTNEMLADVYSGEIFKKELTEYKEEGLDDSKIPGIHQIVTNKGSNCLKYLGHIFGIITEYTLLNYERVWVLEALLNQVRFAHPDCIRCPERNEIQLTNYFKPNILHSPMEIEALQKYKMRDGCNRETTKNCQLSIKHYAGLVDYDLTEMSIKNCDKLDKSKLDILYKNTGNNLAKTVLDSFIKSKLESLKAEPTDFTYQVAAFVGVYFSQKLTPPDLQPRISINDDNNALSVAETMYYPTRILFRLTKEEAITSITVQNASDMPEDSLLVVVDKFNGVIWHTLIKRSQTVYILKHDTTTIYLSTRKDCITYKFLTEMASLRSDLEKTDMQFVRCIKPYQNITTKEVTLPFVIGQLVASGIMETIAIKQKGYPTKLTFPMFLDEYERYFPCMRLNTTDTTIADRCKQLLTTITSFQTVLELGSQADHHGERCEFRSMTHDKKNIAIPDAQNYKQSLFLMGHTKVLIKARGGRILKTLKDTRMTTARSYLRACSQIILSRRKVERVARIDGSIPDDFNGNHKKAMAYKYACRMFPHLDHTTIMNAVETSNTNRSSIEEQLLISTHNNLISNKHAFLPLSIDLILKLVHAKDTDTKKLFQGGITTVEQFLRKDYNGLFIDHDTSTKLEALVKKDSFTLSDKIGQEVIPLLVG